MVIGPSGRAPSQSGIFRGARIPIARAKIGRRMLSRKQQKLKLEALAVGILRRGARDRADALIGQD